MGNIGLVLLGVGMGIVIFAAVEPTWLAWLTLAIIGVGGALIVNDDDF